MTKKIDVRTDANVRKWLAGQKWSVDKLFDSGRTLLLWIKLAVKDSTTNEAEVREYISKHPFLHFIPARTQLTLSQFDVPVTSRKTARGVAQAELLAPTVSVASRSGLSEIRGHQAKDWEDLELYLEINQLEPLLRKALEGKKLAHAIYCVLRHLETCL